ncbi:hypothetical protein ACLB2K_073316 [Fragaria x ananassa]
MCKMVIMGKRKDRATKASALMESIRQSVGSASSSSHPTPMPVGIVPPGAPPLIVQLPIVDTSSTRSPSSTPALESAKRIVNNACLKVRNLTGQKIKLEYCPRVKGPSVRGLNNLVTHDIGSAIVNLVGMRARMLYDLDQEEKWKVWNAIEEGTKRYKDWKYQCHKAYMKEWPSGIPLYFIGREDQWEFLCEHFESDAFKRLSFTNKRNRGEKTMHHHTGSSLIIYIMEELKIQGEQLPIIKGFENTYVYVREGDEVITKHYNDMVDEVNKQNDAFKEQHPDTTEEEIMESVQSQQIEVLGMVLKTWKEKEIRGMGRGGERDLSHGSNGSTSQSLPPIVDEQ